MVRGLEGWEAVLAFKRRVAPKDCSIPARWGAATTPAPAERAGEVPGAPGRAPGAAPVAPGYRRVTRPQASTRGWLRPRRPRRPRPRPRRRAT